MAIEVRAGVGRVGCLVLHLHTLLTSAQMISDFQPTSYAECHPIVLNFVMVHTLLSRVFAQSAAFLK